MNADDLDALSAWMDGEAARRPEGEDSDRRTADYAAIDAALRRHHELALSDPLPIALAAAIRAESTRHRKRARRAAIARWIGPLAASAAVIAVAVIWADQRADRAWSDQQRLVAAMVDSAVQDALETAESGTTRSFGDLASFGIRITPRRTYRSRSQHWCREFEETVVIEGETFVRLGLACREPDRGWRRVDAGLREQATPPI